MKYSFRLLSKISLVLIYLVIIAGSTVRMTGSGMGCPDWPKCFGYFIPPTHNKQLLFEPYHKYKKGMMILKNSEKFMVAKQDFTSNDKYIDEDWKPLVIMIMFIMIQCIHGLNI